MKSSLILVSLAAGLALASPIQKRQRIETEVVYEYVTITVPQGGSPAAPTAFVPANRHQFIPEVQPSQPQVQAQAADYNEETGNTPAKPQSGAKPVTGSSKPASSDEEDTLNAHNEVRALHGSPPLTWSKELADIAQEITNTCVFDHVMDLHGVSYSQNLGQGHASGRAMVGSMYGEKGNYSPSWYGGEPDMSQSDDFGHFTAMIWKASTQVGCAVTECSGGSLRACNFASAGNVVGAYGENVPAPI